MGCKQISCIAFGSLNNDLLFSSVVGTDG